MKIIFLDVDGVLNYTGCPDKIGSIYFVNDEKIKLLKQIIDETDAKIVLSSTWRMGWDEMRSKRERLDFLRLKEKLEEYDIHFFSKTPILYSFKCHRGTEIKQWLDEWEGEKIESFVILDDDSDMEPFMDHLVKTSTATGITEENVKEAIRMLQNVKFSINK